MQFPQLNENVNEEELKILTEKSKVSKILNNHFLNYQHEKLLFANQLLIEDTIRIYTNI